MRVLITGGSGLLALNWALAWSDRFEVILALHQTEAHLGGVQSVWMRYDDFDQMQKQFEELEPQVVIHTAGLTNVDLCETNPERAFELNTNLAEAIAQISKNLGVKLIHISTDQLFDGSKDWYSEHDELSPLNVYGKSKGMAEVKVQTHCPEALIIRTNFFGWGGIKKQSLSDWILNRLRSGQQVHLFQDVYFSPILIEELAMTCADLLKQEASGVYNVAGNERLTKRQFGLLLADVFHLDSSLILPIDLSDMDLLAVRPSNMALVNAKCEETTGRKLPSLEIQCKRLQEQELHGQKEAVLKAIQ